MMMQLVWRTVMSRPGLTTELLLVKLLFCAPIDSTAENCRKPSPRRIVKVSKSTSGIHQQTAPCVNLRKLCKLRKPA